MTERQDTSLKDSKGKRLIVTISDEFKLIRLETDDGEIVMDLYDFSRLAEWVKKK